MLLLSNACNGVFVERRIPVALHSLNVGFHATARVQSLHAKYLEFMQSVESLAHWLILRPPMVKPVADVGG